MLKWDITDRVLPSVLLRGGDSGGSEALNFQSDTKLSNSPLILSKFMKKGNK